MSEKILKNLQNLPNGSILVDDSLMPIYQKTMDTDNNIAWYDIINHKIIDDIKYHSSVNYGDVYLYLSPLKQPLKIETKEL